MSSPMAALGIDRLGPAERARPVAEILDGMPDQPPPPATAGRDEELDRRLAPMDADPSALRPWAGVETLPEMGEAPPRPDPVASDPEMDPEEPNYLHPSAGSEVSPGPAGVAVP